MEANSPKNQRLGDLNGGVNEPVFSRGVTRGVVIGPQNDTTFKGTGILRAVSIHRNVGSFLYPKIVVDFFP